MSCQLKLYETEQHADACGRKSPVPVLKRQPAADEGSERRAEIDAHIKEREAAVAARVVELVQLADYRCDIGLQ